VAVAAHPEAMGVVVDLATTEGDVLRVDVGSGAVSRRSALTGAGDHTGPWLVMARRHGYVLSSPSDPGGVILGVSDDPHAPPTVLSATVDDNPPGTTQVAPAAEPDEVWLWNQTSDTSTVLRRVRIDGSVTAGPVTLPRFAFVLGADGPGAVALSGPGGMYRATVTGTAVAVALQWPRLPVAYNDASLLDLSCDGSLNCRLQIVDRATRRTRAVRQAPGDVVSPYLESLLSPDGAWLAHIDGRGEPTLTVYDVRGDGTPISHEILAGSSFGPLGQPVSFGFSPDGRWLAFLGVANDIELWAVGTTEPPLSIVVPGGHDLSGLSVAPA
jgi:hypothetical protein